MRASRMVRSAPGRDFPQDPASSCRGARDAVFRSWMNERADLLPQAERHPRRPRHRGQRAGDGVRQPGRRLGHRRRLHAQPSTGENGFYGEYLMNAQGEDVVAGIRTPHPIAELERRCPRPTRAAPRDHRAARAALPGRAGLRVHDRGGHALHAPDPQRQAHRRGRGADRGRHGGRGPDQATRRCCASSRQLDQLLHPVFDPEAREAAAARAKGSPHRRAPRSGAWSSPPTTRSRGRRRASVILVAQGDPPDDIHGMDAAQGILTATGGMTSHAAVVARGMGKPCVAGAARSQIDARSATLDVGGDVIGEGERSRSTARPARCSAACRPTRGRPRRPGRIEPPECALPEFAKFMAGPTRCAGSGVRANADIPRDAKQARAFGAEGIGLCRTEHMFFAEDRLPHVVKMILNAPEARQALARSRIEASSRRGASAAAKQELARSRRAAAQGSPLRRRAREAAADPARRLQGALPGDGRQPGHDPHARPAAPRVPAQARGADGRSSPARRGARSGKKAAPRRPRRSCSLLARVEELHEFNPMLGHRGCRLGITYPEITRDAGARDLRGGGAGREERHPVRPEIMIPLVGTSRSSPTSAPWSSASPRR